METYNVTNFIKNEIQAENIRVRINYSASDPSVLYVDLLTVSISYIPPFRADQFNLTNSTNGTVNDGVNFTRGDVINATAHWTMNAIDNASLGHNGTGSFVNYTVTGGFAGNWTNRTLSFSNYTEFPLAGNVTVRGVYAQDVYGQVNVTSPEHYFLLWGTANVTGLSFSSDSILNGTAAVVYCNVRDSNSSVGIPSYNVSFWKDGVFAGSNVTNSSGVARLLYVDNTAVSSESALYEFKCNITTQPSIFYNSTGTAEASRSMSVVGLQAVNLTGNYTVYNRGENLTMAIIDTSNNTVGNVSWVVNLTKFGENKTTIYTGFNDSYTYQLNSTDPEGNWTLLVNGTKQGHSLQHVFSFNVSANLTVTFADPSSGTEYGKNVVIADPNPKVIVKNARGENLSYTVTVNISCPNTIINFSYSGGIYENASVSCRAYDGYSASFLLTANATDPTYNNTGNGSVSLTTSAQPTGSVTPSGGGGPAGGFTQRSCNCTGWVNEVCGAGNCSEFELYQKRICTPAGCDLESRCLEHPVCTAGLDFDFTTGQAEISIDQGETQSVTGSLANPTNFTLNISIGLESGCCAVTSPGGFNLTKAEVKDFPIEIHVPLSQATGEYLITTNVTASVSGISMLKTVVVRLVVTENPAVAEIKALEARLESLNQRIGEFSASGIDPTGLKEQAAQVRSLLDQAAQSVAADDVSGLATSVESANGRVGEAEATLVNLGIFKTAYDNKWNILFFFIIMVVLSYLVTQVIRPYARLRREAVRLAREEEALAGSRRETEKNYFSRKIDEKSFNSIMMETQGKIYKVRGDLAIALDEKRTLLRKKLTPKALGSWIKRGMTRGARRGEKADKKEKTEKGKAAEQKTQKDNKKTDSGSK